MSRATALCVGDHPDPNFKREGPFRYFDLPTEVRDQILRLLLVRENVALGREKSIRNRFSGWSHEKPMWQLLSVNGQLRAEAKVVLFSQRNNTFYFPIGGTLIGVAWWYMLGRPSPHIQAVPPPIRKLDCAFDMRDFEETTFNMFEGTKRDYDDEMAPGDVSFERLPPFERLDLIHDSYRSNMLRVWRGIAEAFCMMELYLLRLDVSKAHCPLGCCRLVEEAVGFVKGFRHCRRPYPKRIEKLGALDHETGSLKKFIEDRNLIPKDRYVFVDTPGCKCHVGSRNLSAQISLADSSTIQTDPETCCNA